MPICLEKEAQETQLAGIGRQCGYNVHILFPWDWFKIELNLLHSLNLHKLRKLKWDVTRGNCHGEVLLL